MLEYERSDPTAVRLGSLSRMLSSQPQLPPLWAQPRALKFFIAVFIDWFGTGLLLTSIPVFLIRTVGLTGGEIGFGLTVAALVGLAFSVPIGALADRWNSRDMLIVLHVWRAVVFIAYAVLVDDFVSFLILLSLIEIAEQSAPAVTQSFVRNMVSDDQRIGMLAYSRTIVNVGISVGGLAAAVAMTSLTRERFSLVLLGNGMSFAVAALLMWRLPRQVHPPTPVVRSRESQRIPRRVFFIAPFDGILGLYIVVLNVALPIWVVQNTTAPPYSVGVLYAVNTVLCVLLQIAVSRFAESLTGAARSLLVSGSLLGISSITIGYAAYAGTPVTAIAILAVGIVLLSVGEMLHSVSSWQVSYSLAPEGREAATFAVFNIGRISGRVVGPVLMTAVVVSYEIQGWIGLGVAFLTSAVVMSLFTFKLAQET